MKKIFIAAVMLLFACAGFAQNNSNNAPLVIKEQGSFLAGGTVIKGEGVYDTHDQTNPHGQTLHGDHAYVSYQIPAVSNPTPMVLSAWSRTIGQDMGNYT